MMTYEVENDENCYRDTDAKTHCLRIMRHLKENKHAYFRLNAYSYKEIQKLELMLELMNKWIFVEEIFSDKTVF